MEQEKQGFFEKHEKAVIVGALILIAALALVPDNIIRKYVPWVK